MTRVFCTDDVVYRKSNEDSLGSVERTHGDVDTHDPHPNSNESERIRCDRDIPKKDFRRFLKDGVPPKHTVLVRWMSSDHAYLIPESKLEVLDRSLLIGDVVKKDMKDAMSGVILNTFTTCTLQPISDVTITGNGQSGDNIRLKGLPPTTGLDPRLGQIALQKARLVKNVPASELKHSEAFKAEDLVMYKGWIGRVEDVHIFITLKLCDNCVVEIQDDMAEHLDGADDDFNVGDIVTTKKGVLRTGKWIYGKYNPNTMPMGTVVATRVVSADVTWLERRIGMAGSDKEPPSTLERTELESSDFAVYDRTIRPQPSGDRNEFSTISNSEIDVRLNLRVRFKDLSGACVKYGDQGGKDALNRIDRKDHLGYDLNVYDVVRFQTEVTVQWQDVSITRERSTNLIPEIGIDDEHDAWPGEIAHTLDLKPVEDLRQVKQAHRVGIVQCVDALERMASVKWCSKACLQYSEDDEAPGLRNLVSGLVGIVDGSTEELSLYDIEAPGELNVRRGDIVLISNPSWAPSSDSTDQDWLGEIVDTRLDGLLTIRLSAANHVRDVNLRREDVVVAIRSDMSDEMDVWDDDESPRVQINSDGEIEVLDESDSELDAVDDSDDSISFDDFFVDESDEEDVKYEDENGKLMDVDDVENEEWESASEGAASDVDMADASEDTPMTSQSATPSDTSKREQRQDGIDETKSQTDVAAPAQYLILDSAVPTTHAFSLKSSTDSVAHMKRVQKEHNILRTPSNLPKGVYVRTWESRLDLLRILFIGPEDTPYAYAPFIIDFYLAPSFPSDPPQAHFHSWTLDSGLGGVGRVNPNLYEDGKICLSLLGTWESGKSSEGWMASKSTLLQVIVSILGLVLVSEPYFNEAGYEHLAAMQSAKRASQLYSERVYLKARTFIIVALNSTGGSEGLSEVMDWLYRRPEGDKLLERAILDAEGVLKRSGAGEGMSKGARLSLQKILNRLKTV